MRQRRDSQLGAGAPLISPLVDVVFNAMGAIFLFFVIYLVLVQPSDEPPPLEMHTKDLVPAVWAEPYSAAVVATGGAWPHEFEVIGGTLPQGLELDAQSGVLRGLPQPPPGEANLSRQYLFQVRVADSAGRDVERLIRLPILPTSHPFDPSEHMLSFETNRLYLPHAWKGLPYEAALGVVGGIEPYAYRVVNGSLPPGLGLEGSVIRGVPEESGAFEFEVEVRDQQEHHGILERQGIRPQDRRTAKLHVHERSPLAIAEVLPEARAGFEYEGSVAAEGGIPPYSWKIVAGTLPSGLTSDAEAGRFGTLRIAGTPRERGSYPIEFVVQDDRGEQSSAKISVNVLPPCESFEVVTDRLPPARVGREYRVDLAARCGTEPLTWKIRKGNLPAGIAFSTGSIAGTPEAPGDSDITIEANDASGRAAQQRLDLRVEPRPQPLELPRP